MTYCLAIRVRDGIVALADGRITSGSQVTAARKLTLHGIEGRRFFVMTAGLRSIRDKTLAYLERRLRQGRAVSDSMLDVVTEYAKCLRVTEEEDKEALERSKLDFDLTTLIGGYLPDDPRPTVFLIYPQGNWVEVEERTPYLSIGQTGYGKPILDRALRYDTELGMALKVAYLSFDSTRTSSTSVGYPVDMATFTLKDRQWRSAEFDVDDLAENRRWWNAHITGIVNEMPPGPWVERLLP